EVAVLVVADGCHGRQHQPARAPDLGFLRPEVLVLPEHAEVLFVQADGVADGQWAAIVVVDDSVEVMNLAETVAAELQAVAHHADALPAHFQHLLPEGFGSGAAIGDDNLGKYARQETRRS